LQPFTLVCDPGVDDVVGLAVLVGAGHPPARVVAVSGNVTSATAARVAAGACALFRLDVPVFEAGDDRPARPTSRHGDDGFVGLASELPHASWSALAAPIGGDVLATAPMTVVARGRERGRVLWQGGGFNHDADPEAAAHVPCEVVPIEVAGRVRIEPGGPPVIAEAMRRYGAVLHDAVAAVAWYRADLFDWVASRAVDVYAEAVSEEIASMLSRVL
jgi:inosine-uridine nucleoside N-ribohydrolase